MQAIRVIERKVKIKNLKMLIFRFIKVGAPKNPASVLKREFC